MKITILRTSGKEEIHSAPVSRASEAICDLIGARILNHVNLRDGRIMMLDDLGYQTETIEHSPNDIELKCVKALKPVNAEATKLYHRVAHPR